MDKYKIFAIIFILITYFISIGSVISNATYFSDPSKVYNDAKIKDISKLVTLKEKLSFVFGENNLFSKQLIEIWSLLNSSPTTADISLIEDSQYGNLIKDEKDNLYFPESKKDITTYANKTINLANNIKNFIYIQAPNKVIPGYTNSLVLNYNHANENADEFINLLNKNNIKTYDLRKKLKELDNKDSLFYKTDHHWTTKTSFWAFDEIVNELNSTFNLSIDLEHYYRDLNNYNIKEYENCYLGSLGRRTGKSVAGLDDYTFISPKFPTKYELYNMLQSKNTAIAKGNFDNAIVAKGILESADVESNKHATYFKWDYGYLKIINELAPNDIKILLIKDSYSLPFAAFLSTTVKELEMIDLRDTPKANLQEIIKANDYDVVVMMYNTEGFTDTLISF